MTPLRRFAITLSPFFILGACSELIGLSDYEKGDVLEGEGGEGSTGGRASGGKGGSSGVSGSKASGGVSGRGGSSTGGRGGSGNVGPGGEGGDAGVGGEPEGGSSGTRGGTAGRAGAAGGGMGGSGGTGGAGKGGVGGGGAGSGGAGTGGAGTGGAGTGGAGTGGAGQGGSGGGGCTTVPISILSPGFDTDTSAWVVYYDPPPRVIIVSGTSVGITAQSSPNVAHLGGDDSVYAGHFQRIMIPAGAITMTLTGYRWVTTEETGTTIYDQGAIQLWQDAVTPSGYIGQFLSYTNATPTSGWTMFTGSVAVNTFAGQAVDLDMWAQTDISNVTDFFIDSLSLSAFVCN